MQNLSKPTTSLTNSDKVVQYETFDTLTTTFDTETRTFNQMQTTWSNQQSPLYQFLLLETDGFLLTEDRNKIMISNSSLITNIAKP
jgi:signal transduction histidine kinase